MLVSVVTRLLGESCLTESGADDQPERRFTINQPMRIVSIARGWDLLWFDLE